VTGAARKREVGRGERVLPGVWRLRLPLPWPGIPHCNAWAMAAGDGIVLVDCGMHEPGSFAHLERALGMVGLRIEHVRLLVCTHAHSDHYGQAAPVIARTGCELWMHPNHGHTTVAAGDPDAALERRLEIARSAGVPEEPLRAWAQAGREQSYGVAGIVAPDRDLVTGVVVESDLGPWEAIETPGHAPSHVCLFQRDRRLLISGDHVLGRVSLYYDYGYTPDPVGEFLASLDRVELLDARLGLSGHGRTFSDVEGHVVASREAVAERVAAVEAALRDSAPVSAFDVAARVFGEAASEPGAGRWLGETLCYLRHLEVAGRAVRDGSAPERWAPIDGR
jgi:glyoxylase-like metal-dependent hydrolase (beta-lactamase superfamily II)